ncbi:MAG TPA: hypothetical protein IAC26_06335 [Candidatus Scatomorpha stercoravium]|nr:hypothetical protein [Candidatus Scatomorpha stercoravium]
MKRIAAIIACLLMLALLPTAAFADMGPKPSVRIGIEGLDPDEPCWGTLLSEEASTGPSRAYDGENARVGEAGEDVWRAFVDYEDPDGYYFLQELWPCSEDGQLWWTYYPPEEFKLLLYFPETGEFVSSGKCSAYAFTSWFDARLSDGELALSKSYDYSGAIVNFAVRCALTVALECAAAYFLFRLRTPGRLKAVAAVNVITQLALNLVVNIIAYLAGSFMIAFRFFLLECLVFAAEGALYDMFFRRAGEPVPVKRCWALSLVGNLMSYALGLWLAYAVPGLF